MSREDTLFALQGIVGHVRQPPSADLPYADRLERAACDEELLRSLSPIDQFAALTIRLLRALPADRKYIEREHRSLRREFKKFTGWPQEADTEIDKR